MLLVTKDEKSSPTKYILSGVIDESTDFATLFGATEPFIQIYCRDVSRINSNGIMNWRQYFRKLRQAGGKLRFFEIAPILVTAINCIADFIEMQEIGSVCAPYQCNKCKKYSLKTLTPVEAKRLMATISIAVCEHCTGEAELDEDPAEYFTFLKT